MMVVIVVMRVVVVVAMGVLMTVIMAVGVSCAIRMDVLVAVMIMIVIVAMLMVVAMLMLVGVVRAVCMDMLVTMRLLVGRPRLHLEQGCLRAAAASAMTAHQAASSNSMVFTLSSSPAMRSIWREPQPQGW